MDDTQAPPGPQHGVARLFDQLAETYDQVGVDFFQPVAARLVSLLEPCSGERAADIGCGRGAVTLPLATAVGPDGEVLACDLSPAMVAATAQLAQEQGLRQVRTAVRDASRPDLEPGTFDLVAASLVLFFLPDPAAAASAWAALLRPGGRLGITTFGRPDGAWAEIDALFEPHLPQAMLDARGAALRGPFASDEGVAALLTGAALGAVSTSTERADLFFDDTDHWHRWSMSTGQRAMWGLVPPDDRTSLRRAAEQVMEATRQADGRLLLSHDMRYTVGRRA